MVPEKRDAIPARADDYAHSRVARAATPEPNPLQSISLLVFLAARRLISVQQSNDALLLGAYAEAVSDHLFEDLFLEHYPKLVKTLVRLTGNRGEAEELAADAFCRLHQHRGRHRPDDNPAGWLYRTAINLGLDALRTKARRSRREGRAQQEQPPGEMRDNPLSELLAEEQRARVRSVIARMKPIQGQVLLMGSSGFTCKEMAAVLGLKPDSLYVLIARAKERFEREYATAYGRAE